MKTSLASLVGIVALALVFSITLDEANADGRNSPNKIYCDTLVSPVVSDTHTHNVTSESTFDVEIEVYQEFGDCIWMSGNVAHLYTVPYMPLMYKVEVFDVNFPEEILGTNVLTNIMTENFTLSMTDISVGIEYDVKVTSYFMNEENVTETVSGGTVCYEEDPLEVDF